MNMFWHEIKSNYKSLLGWIAGILFFQLSGYSKFQGFKAAQGSSSINVIANSFPKPLLAIFGMSNLNIATLIGYFGILYIFFALIAAIYSGLLGANIVSKEERDKTSEFIYTKPVSRTSVLGAKFFAGLINILILFVIINLSSIVGVGITNSNNFTLTGQVTNLMWGILLIQTFFYCMGIMFASIFKSPKTPTVIIATVIVASYFISVLSELSTNLEWLKYLTPFQWFSAPSLINSGHVAYGYVIVVVILSTIFTGIGWYIFNKRDITVV